jgi:uncharacterized membrane protein
VVVIRLATYGVISVRKTLGTIGPRPGFSCEPLPCVVDSLCQSYIILGEAAVVGVAGGPDIGHTPRMAASSNDCPRGAKIMAIDNHIRNPIEWFGERLVGIASAATAFRVPHDTVDLPAIRKIGLSDIRYAISHGTDDLLALRTYALSIVFIYPAAGILLIVAAGTNDLLPLVFPLASGFALIGPIAGIGLYTMSRRRELEAAGKTDVGTPVAYGAIAIVSLLLIVIFVAWLAAAYWIFYETLGPEVPQSIAAFIRDAFTTRSGWLMIVVGFGVGFLFAVVALSIGVFSIPLMLDKPVGPITAIRASLRAVAENPASMAVWGVIVAAGLVVGSIPALIGLMIVIPLFGHSTWHLYGRIMPDRP